MLKEHGPINRNRMNLRSNRPALPLPARWALIPKSHRAMTRRWTFRA
jgi:hypothetical protein